MYLKMVKTLSANHTSHTYKKSIASLHVPSSGKGHEQALWDWAGPSANMGGSAAQRGWAGRESYRPQPRAREFWLDLQCTEGSCSGQGTVSGVPSVPRPPSRPEQWGWPRSSVPRNQGYSHPHAESDTASPHGSDGTEQLPHASDYLHPANQAQVQARQNSAQTLLALTLHQDTKYQTRESKRELLPPELGRGI